MLNSFHQAAEVERLRFMLHEQVPFLDNFLLIWSSIDANHNWYQSKLKHDIEKHEKYQIWSSKSDFDEDKDKDKDNDKYI